MARKSVDLTTLAGWSSLSTGSHSITIVAKANGYRDSEPSAAVSVEKAATVPIWGVSGLGNSNPTLTRTYDNVGKTYSINSSAGTITTDFDTEFNFETVVQNGNTMIKIPTFYKRIDAINNNQITAFSISKTKVNDDFKPYPCFVKQDSSGAVMDYILVSKGKATGTSSKATCVSGASPLVNVTRAQMRTAARANGTGWQQFDWMVLQLLRDLFCVVFATTNSQSIFKGRVSNGSVNVGATWNMTTPCGWSITTLQNRFFGIEDIFGNYWDWCDGVAFNGTSIYFTIHPSLFSDTTNNMTYAFSKSYGTSTVIEYIKQLRCCSDQPFFNYPYNTSAGTNSTYYCDKYWDKGDGTVLMVGTGSGDNLAGGLWATFGMHSSTSSGRDIGGRLVYRPV